MIVRRAVGPALYSDASYVRYTPRHIGKLQRLSYHRQARVRFNFIRGVWMRRVKVIHSVGWTEARRHNRVHYRAVLNECRIQAIASSEDHPRQIDIELVIRCRLRDQLQRYLSEREITTELYWAVPLHAELYAR